MTAPPDALIFAGVSVKDPPVRSAVRLLFVKVRVTVDAVPVGIEVGLNVLAIVAGPSTVSVAVLLAAPTVEI